MYVCSLSYLSGADIRWHDTIKKSGFIPFQSYKFLHSQQPSILDLYESNNSHLQQYYLLSYQEEEIYQIGNITFNYSLCNIRFKDLAQNMSVRQSDILRILVQHLNSIVERDYLLDNVWGCSNYNNSLSLNVQITYLRKILEADNTISINSLSKRGYVLKVSKN